jgi:hypothetical protein
VDIFMQQNGMVLLGGGGFRAAVRAYRQPPSRVWTETGLVRQKLASPLDGGRSIICP